MTHFDFEFFLVIAAAVTGLLWLIDALFFARGRKQSESGQDRNEPLAIEYSRAFFPVLLAVLYCVHSCSSHFVSRRDR